MKFIIIGTLLISGFIFFKLKFKTYMGFRFFLLKKIILYKRYFTRIGKISTPIDSIGEKSILLWKKAIRDKESKVYQSFDGQRQLKTENTLFILKEEGYERGYLKVYHNCSKNGIKNVHYYNVYIPKEYFSELVEVFNIEVQKRMRMIENLHRKQIEDSIFLLIEDKEKQ